MLENDLLHVLPLVSAALWIAIGTAPILRRQLRSPFEQAITVVAILLGLWALLDWVFLGLQVQDPDQESLAVAISNVRITIITFATFALLLAGKWVYLGHSRYDIVLFVPVLASLALIWSGMTFGAKPAWWGPQLERDPLRYSLWAAQQVIYVGASVAFTLGLYFQRHDLEVDRRRRIFFAAGALLVLLASWIATNIYNNVTQTPGIPWFSSLLLIPAVIVVVALLPLSPEEWNDTFSRLSAVPERVMAAYLFYRSGEPLVALSASETYPIEAEQLEGVLTIVGNFVETSVAGARGYDLTAMRYEALGILAVRGQFVIAAAVYDGRAYDALRSDLIRIVKRLEELHWRDLQTWELATKAAESVADELSALLYRRPSGARGASRGPAGARPGIAPTNEVPGRP